MKFDSTQGSPYTFLTPEKIHFEFVWCVLKFDTMTLSSKNNFQIVILGVKTWNKNIRKYQFFLNCWVHWKFPTPWPSLIQLKVTKTCNMTLFGAKFWKIQDTRYTCNMTPITIIVIKTLSKIEPWFFLKSISQMCISVRLVVIWSFWKFGQLYNFSCYVSLQSRFIQFFTGDFYFSRKNDIFF